jgi:hypothetical protein
MNGWPLDNEKKDDGTGGVDLTGWVSTAKVALKARADKSLDL